LYCKAGGTSVGYSRAGFEVVGVDIEPQPRYPFEFRQGDALDVLDALAAGREPWPGSGEFDAIAASPPCQDNSLMQNFGPVDHGTWWLLGQTRRLLQEIGLPWVIENVPPHAPMRPDYQLCGCMFGLPELRRVRWFETSWRGFDLRPPCCHVMPAISVVGHGSSSSTRRRLGRSVNKADYTRVMGIEWMTRDEMAQAVPPPYTEYVGGQLMAELNAPAA